MASSDAQRHQRLDSPVDSRIASLQAVVSKSLVALTRTTNSLAAADIDFQKSLDPEFEKGLLILNSRLRSIADRLVQSVHTASSDQSTNTRSSHRTNGAVAIWDDNISGSSGKTYPKPNNPNVRPEDEDSAVESLERNWKGLVDIVDLLLEKADSSLDEFTGVVKRLNPTDIEAGNKSRTQPTTKFRYLDLPKPQLQFENPPSNSTTTFKPLLTSKPHASVSLTDSLKTSVDSHGKEQYKHPYEVEIENYSYPDVVLQTSEPIMYSPFAETTAVFVDSPEAVDQMLAELKKEKLIAIDLEHHDLRTYTGLLSLMQISTRTKDWIVDTLQPWRGHLQCLNEVFADPSIVKVFHGAMMDIIWLQRDLGLYIVGLFDTGHAARTLGYPAASLAYLLQRFVNFDAQKQYQMADWRVRPLPQEMFDYARSDTHFLLYIYDCVRNDLLLSDHLPSLDGVSEPQSRISIVSQKSKETCLQTYHCYNYDKKTGQGPGGWYPMLTRAPVVLSPEQFEVFRSLHAWRDRVAREEDEGTHYFMPNHAIFSLSNLLPTDKARVLAAYTNPSPLFRTRLDEVVTVIKQARARGAKGPSMFQVLDEIGKTCKPKIRTGGGFVTGGLSMGDTVKMLKLDSYKQESTSPLPEFAVPSHDTAINWTDAQTLQKFNPAHRMNLQSSSSMFWGKVLPKPENLPATEDVTNIRDDLIRHNVPDISLPVPLPDLTALIFEQGGTSSMADLEAHPEKGPASHQFVPATERNVVVPDEVFIVRQLGMKKRSTQTDKKKKEDDDNGDIVMSDSSSVSGDGQDAEVDATSDPGSPSQPPHPPLSPTSSSAYSPSISTPTVITTPKVLSTKASRKEEKLRPEQKTMKKLKKEKAQKRNSKKPAKSSPIDSPTTLDESASASASATTPNTPFDYSTAPSVLNSKDPSSSRRRKMDPFKRALEAPKAGKRQNNNDDRGKAASWAKSK